MEIKQSVGAKISIKSTRQKAPNIVDIDSLTDPWIKSIKSTFGHLDLNYTQSKQFNTSWFWKINFFMHSS